MSSNVDLAKMSIKAGIEGEGKPMKVADPKSAIKGRMQPVATTAKPTKGKPNTGTHTGESIF